MSCLAQFKLKTFGFSRIFHGAKPGAGSGAPLQGLFRSRFLEVIWRCKRLCR